MANLSLCATKPDFGSSCEGNTFPRLDVFGRLIGSGDDPFFGREILQAPDVWVCRVLHNLGHGASEVEWLMVIEMMREEFGLVREHHDGLAQAKPIRETRHLLAERTGPRIARRLEQVEVIEILLATMLAEENGISQTSENPTPFSFHDAVVRVVQARRERLREGVAEKLWVNRPIPDGVGSRLAGRIDRFVHGGIGLVLRIKNEERLIAEELHPGRQVPTANAQYPATEQWMADMKDVKQQHSERVQVRLPTR